MLTVGTLPTKGMELKEFSWIWFGINHFCHSEIGDRGSYIKQTQTLDTKKLGSISLATNFAYGVARIY